MSIASLLGILSVSTSSFSYTEGLPIINLVFHFSHLAPCLVWSVYSFHLAIYLPVPVSRLRIPHTSLYIWLTCFSIRFRRAWAVQGHSIEELPFQALGGVYGSWFGVVLIVIVLIAQFYIVRPCPPELIFNSFLIFALLRRLSGPSVDKIPTRRLLCKISLPSTSPSPS